MPRKAVNTGGRQVLTQWHPKPEETMRFPISLTLASLFVVLAGFNVWSMLTSRGTSLRGNGLWTRIHRIAGYAFITLFAILCSGL